MCDLDVSCANPLILHVQKSSTKIKDDVCTINLIGIRQHCTKEVHCQPQEHSNHIA